MLDREIAGYLDTDIEIEKGIYITSVIQGLPAEKAGLKAEDVIQEYATRLTKYCKLDIIEVPDEKAPENMSEAMEAAVRYKEGQAILKQLRDDTYVIALAIQGKQLSSEKFAELISDLGLRGKSNIASVLFCYDVSSSANAGDIVGAGV